MPALLDQSAPFLSSLQAVRVAHCGGLSGILWARLGSAVGASRCRRPPSGLSAARGRPPTRCRRRRRPRRRDVRQLPAERPRAAGPAVVRDRDADAHGVQDGPRRVRRCRPDSVFARPAQRPARARPRPAGRRACTARSRSSGNRAAAAGSSGRRGSRPGRPRRRPRSTPRSARASGNPRVADAGDTLVKLGAILYPSAVLESLSSAAISE
jgi:hypothetical protein